LDEYYDPPAGSVYWTELYDMEHHLVYGHNVHSLSNPTMVTKPNGAQLVGIDTGACFGGRLTAFLVPESKEARVTEANFVQVVAAKAYSRSVINAKD
jgi:serine/threonine protein phosphatase 1